MEENVGILIADLAGYTALTETHGAFAAADVVDKFVEIVHESLVGESKLHERVGDEVVIVSSSPDHLLDTAVMLIQNCYKEHHFLQVHGALHYGSILKRNNHYFGSSLNLTSRIAAKATKGTFWSSSEFVNALSDRAQFIFRSKGLHSFKNVREEVEVFELMIEHTDFFQIDPVCRMLIVDKTKAIQHPEKNHLFFCSHSCLDIFKNSESANSASDTMQL